MASAIYDIVILGSGPAGLTAAIYACRANLKTLCIAGITPGGQLMITTDVENYPGFPEGVKGPELMDLMRKQAERFGTVFVDDDASAVDLTANPKKVWVGEDTYEGRALILATGAKAKYLGLPNEERLQNRGVSACATCLPAGSTIMANSAPVAIEEVEDGQRVLTDDGTFQPVIGRGSRPYEGELIRIVVRYFREEATLLTPEHPVLAAKLFKGTGTNYWKRTWQEPEWVPAGDLTDEHILLYPIVSETRDVPTLRLSLFLGLPRDTDGRVHFARETATSRRLPDELPMDGDFMRLAGYFLADGTITPRGINFYFGPKDDTLVDDVVQIMARLFDYRVSVKREGSVRRIESYSGILRELFLKLFGKYSYGKSVPHWFLYMPTEKQAELVKGFWRGDGGMRPLDFVLVTNSPKLVVQFKMILLRLGIVPGVARQSAERLNRTQHTIGERVVRFKHDRYQIEIGGAWLKRASEVLGVDHPLLLRRTRTNQHAWIRDGHAFLPISDLRRVPFAGTVHNIAVAGRNSYVTAGATVHNCDGFFFKDKPVVVVGGGDTSMEESSYLANLCSSVTIIHRRDAFRASKIMQDRVLKNPKIQVIWDTEVVDVLGKDNVEGVRLKHVKTGVMTDLSCAGLFLAIGHNPSTGLFVGKLPLNETGYLLLEHRGHGSFTKIPGVFAAGDIHDWTYRQAVTAAGWGCVAALDAERWLQAQGH